MCLTSTSTFTESISTAPMRFHSLAEWLAWQEGLHFTAIELGLDRCKEVADRMDLLSPDFLVISIAGTNGKGSSATMLDIMLRNSSYNVGLYTSPHLIRYNERIRIGGTEINDEIICQSFNRIDQARGDISLTYFEFGTLAALDIFQQAGIELAIMEVGLGGRLDAVNLLNADVALVCSIDLDHENWLGHNRDVIGHEKAGIFRAASPAVCSDLNPPESIKIMLKLSARNSSWQEEITYLRYLRILGPGRLTLRHYQVYQNPALIMINKFRMQPAF